MFLANHSSWWDFFLAHYLNSIIPVDGYGMTEYANMAKYGFFRRIGAFSVDRTNPMAVRASIEYSVLLLKRGNAGVWLFPQGKIVCNDVRPLGFQPGLRAIVQKAGRVRLVPTAVRYEFWQDERPEACVRFGAPHWVDRSQRSSLLAEWENRLTQELDALRDDVLTQDAARFITVFHGRDSIHDRYARLARRWLGRFYAPQD